MRQQLTALFFLDFYTLENIQASNGFSFEALNGIIEMDATSYDANGNTVLFLVNKLQMGNVPYSVRHEWVTQWFYDGGRLHLNSEYDSSAGSKKNAYILLIMDTSTSFASQIEAAKQTAGEIVLYISEQM